MRILSRDIQRRGVTRSLYAPTVQYRVRPPASSPPDSALPLLSTDKVTNALLLHSGGAMKPRSTACASPPCTVSSCRVSAGTLLFLTHAAVQDPFRSFTGADGYKRFTWVSDSVSDARAVRATLCTC